MSAPERKLFVRFGAGTPFAPKNCQGHNSSQYPLRPEIAIGTTQKVGDHIYEYVGTIQEVEGPSEKRQVDYVVGEYYPQNDRIRTMRRFVGYLDDRAVFTSISGPSLLFCTKRDGSPLASHVDGMEPNMQTVPGKKTLGLVNKAY